MTPPLISVIVPTHNRREDLGRCLEAIGKQRFRDFEIVVIADSCDADYLASARTILETLPVPYQLIQLSSSEIPRQGPSLVRNRGAALARGAWLAFCDDDDVWTCEDHLETAAAAIEAQPRLGYYFANQTGVLGDEERLPDWLPGLKESVAGRSPLVRGTDVFALSLEDLLALPTFPHLNTTLVSRKLFEKIGGFNEALRYSEDYEFSRRVSVEAELIAGRPAVVARHHIPVPTRRDNASTRLTQMDRRLLMTHIHLNLHLRHPRKSLQQHSRLEFSYECKRLMADADLTSARFLARLALAAAPTLKWLLVTIALHLPIAGTKLLNRINA